MGQAVPVDKVRIQKPTTKGANMLEDARTLIPNRTVCSWCRESFETDDGTDTADGVICSDCSDSIWKQEVERTGRLYWQ